MSYRLRDGLRVEPLVFGWPAWWCNLAPGTAALHALRFQLPALRSYLKKPSAHVRAANDPRLAGGSFVGVPEDLADRVAVLAEAMETEYAADFAFGEAWIAFNEHLRTIAHGQTMEPVYREIPTALAGLVELGYDYDNRPSVRFDESFAYRSELYAPRRQRVLLRDGGADDKRPFYMSTPAIARDDDLEIATAFGSPELAALLDLDLRPSASLSLARERIEAAVGGGGGDLGRWLAEGRPMHRSPWREATTRVRYIGHACLLVEHAGKSILVDPLVPQGTHGPDVFGFEDLPEHVDLALVTHAHPDHFDLETLVRLRSRVGRLVLPRSRGQLIGDVSLKRIAEALGYTDVVELDSGDGIRLDDGEVVALPFLGEHGDILHGSKASYWIRFAKTTIVAAADSACLDERTYTRARALVGAIDHVFMNTEIDGAPISWPFDALFPKGRDRKLESTRKCRGSNVVEGLRMLEATGARQLYVYAMGLEPWVQRITGPASSEESTRMAACRELIAGARARGVGARRLAGPEDLVLGG